MCENEDEVSAIVLSKFQEGRKFFKRISNISVEWIEKNPRRAEEKGP